MPPKKRTKKKRSETQRLAAALKANTRILEEVDRELEVKGGMYFSRPRNYVDAFMHGVLYGLGILAAAVIVIPVLIALLKNVQWIPILGDTVTKVINQVEESRLRGGADYR